MKRRIVGLLVATVLVLCMLTGCVQMERGIYLGSDGSGTITGMVAFDTRLNDLDTSDEYSEMAGSMTSSLDELRNQLQSQNIPVQERKYEVNGVTYEGIEFEVTLEEALRLEKDGSEMNVFTEYTLERENGINLLMYEATQEESAAAASLGMYTKTTIQIDGTIVLCEGAEVIDGTVTFEAGGDFDFLSAMTAVGSENSEEAVTYTSVKVVWEISDTLADVLSQFPSLQGTSGIEIEPVKFTDVRGNWAEEELMKLVDMGVIKGTSDTTLSPDKSLTRAEAVTMLYRVFGDKLKVDGLTAPISDLDTSHWAYDAVAWAGTFGISNGTAWDENGMIFSPDLTLTNEQCAVLLAKTMRLYNIKVLETPWIESNQDALDMLPLLFDDENDISSWAKSSVAEMWMNTGIVVNETMYLPQMVRRDLVQFNPKDGATRAYFAYMLVYVGSLF